MNVKTILGWAAVVVFIAFIIFQPAGAAGVVHNIGTFLASAAHGVNSFFASI